MRAVVDTIDGCDGAPRVDTLTLELVVPEPATLTARTAIEYVVAFASPETVIGEAVLAGDLVTHVEPPSVEYSKFVIVAPPVTPAVKETETCPAPPLTAVMLGAPGVENGVTDDVADEDPAPAAFTARICTS